MVMGNRIRLIKIIFWIIFTRPVQAYTIREVGKFDTPVEWTRFDNGFEKRQRPPYSVTRVLYPNQLLVRR